MDRSFPTSLDSKLRLTTTILLVVLGVIAGLMALAAVSAGSDMMPFAAVLVSYLLIVSAVVSASIGYAPREYRITEQDVSIERGFGPKRIPLDSITTVERLEPDALRGTWRVAGIGGLFCLHGWFRNKQLGEFFMSATRSDRLVLIRTATQRFVLTPDSPDDFVETLRSRVGFQE
jgi:hypothetical protein